VKRFDDKIVHTGVECLDHVFLLGVNRHDEKENVFTLIERAHAPAELRAVDAGHRPVGNNHAWMVRCDHGKGGGGIGSREDFVPVGVEKRHEHVHLGGV